ncbi:copper amine oxidase N-terminal domain-containing protein [Paenibacillus sp. LHD-117]|uniref:copper amine oxidase N-terminal domain-containing protein n=1 Tax=Paenibacillus sp. LHD-117 TaxID=3071412 RepID=UPI0027DF1714|nr:copper amine oxidase N-terminal domain-containing protein [Paenibacillus sp. LHD-117]MDQ6422456.1 copper amine oxidase N-terminal domain-containing protein [Paenibacillus sp. LHD-117]
MKKTFAWLLIIMLTGVLSIPVSAAAASSYTPVGIEIDSEKLEVEAYLVSGRTLVPLRAIFEKLQAEVKWEQATKTVTATKGSTVIELRINDVTASVNKKKVTLDVPPMLINQATFVPLRFVSEALGAEVAFDEKRKAVTISTTASGCNGGQVHTGTIDPAGETWTACGSPHFVKGDFLVEGLESPVLTIEAGAVVRFEKDASLVVGNEEPGGLIINGSTSKPVVLTADSSGPNAGFWKGIRFGEAAVRDKASITGARIEYAGEEDKGALYLGAAGLQLNMTVKDSEFKNSLFAGIHMVDNSRLSENSGNIKITGTKAGTYGGGFPIVTYLLGSHLVPNGTYTGNDIDAVRITGTNTYDILTKSATWRNVGVPYDMEITVTVEGPSNPVLTIEPGVTTKWGPDTFLEIANSNGGGLKAVGTKEKPIVFSGNLEKQSGWMGIVFGPKAVSSRIQLQYASIEYALYGITIYEDLGPIVKDSSFKNNEIGVYMPLYEPGQTDYRTGHGNTFEGNGQDQNID